MCTKERPLGCQHSCPLACHPGQCPPCKQRFRMRCHCNTQVIHSDCQTFTNATEEQKEKIKSCGKSCPKKVKKLFYFKDYSINKNFVLQLLCGHSCAYSCHSGSCSSLNNCLQLVPVRCGCKRINQELPCHEINSTKNYRLPCDEICAELKKNRATAVTTIPNPPVVEELKPIVEIDSPITNRKNRKSNSIEKTTPTIANANSSVKKTKPRRFIWTLNKVILIFGLFTIITISSIIYMFNQIS
jgi:hypothetical protein